VGIHTPKTFQAFIVNFEKLKIMLFNSIFLAKVRLGFGSKNLSPSLYQDTLSTPH